MSRINLRLTIMLIALVLCLSACGENKTDDAVGADQSASQAAEISAETKETVSDDKGWFSDESGDVTVGKDTDGDDNVSVIQNENSVDETSAAQNNNNSNNAAESEKASKAQDESKSNQNDSGNNKGADAEKPTSSVTGEDEEIDNAEVNFNDL